MSRFVPLDAGVIGLLCCSRRVSDVVACFTWVEGLKRAGVNVVLPDISIYEVRRALIRAAAGAKLVRLEALLSVQARVPVEPEAWLKAAEFWAIVRRAGKPTASPDSLDGDAILAGVAATIGAPGDSVTIATTNVRHLSWSPGIDARRWEMIP